MLSRIKSKWNSSRSRSLSKWLTRRLILGVILIVLANGVTLSSSILQLVFLGLLLNLTPVLVVLDYRDLWREGVDSLSLLNILRKGDYQSIIAVTFLTQSLITVGINADGTTMILAWVVSFTLGCVVYPFLLSGILTLTANLTVKTTPVQMEYEEDANTTANTYLDRDWIDFNKPLTAFHEDVDFSKFSLIRYPLDESSDVSFITKVPPKFNEGEHTEFSQEVFQNIHTTLLDTNGCEICHESNKDTYVQVPVRHKICYGLYKIETSYICDNCLKGAVIDVAESDRIPELTKADMIAQEI